MARKWTTAQRRKFKATMAAKKAQGPGKKGMEIPLELIPAPMQPVARKRLVKASVHSPSKVEAEAAAALGELIVSVWEAMQRRNLRR